MVEFLESKSIGSLIFRSEPSDSRGFDRTVPDLMQFWDNFDYRLWLLDHEGKPQPLPTEWPETLIGDCLALPE